MPREEAGSKVPVSRRALIQRINRKLEKDNQQMRTPRSEGDWVHTGGAPVRGGPRRASGGRAAVGNYFVVDFNRNNLVHTNVDIVEFGRKLGVLQPWERLAD